MTGDLDPDDTVYRPPTTFAKADAFHKDLTCGTIKNPDAYIEMTVAEGREMGLSLCDACQGNRAESRGDPDYSYAKTLHRIADEGGLDV